PKPGSRRLFVSRGHLAEAKRRLMNHDEIAGVFAKHGFEVVVAEDLGFMDQVRLFAQAAVVAGPHGSGLANFGFAPPACTLVDLMGPRYDRWYQPGTIFEALANVLGQRHLRIVGTGAGSVPDQFMPAEPYVVSAEQLDAALG